MRKVISTGFLIGFVILVELLAETVCDAMAAFVGKEQLKATFQIQFSVKLLTSGLTIW
jgi:hypothetical protein